MRCRTARGRSIGDLLTAPASQRKNSWSRLAPGVSWGGVCLVGLLAGIGFTMPIFISMLAFSDQALLSAAISPSLPPKCSDLEKARQEPGPFALVLLTVSLVVAVIGMATG